MAPTQSVGCRPIASPRKPPIMEPTGMVPHTMNRMVAFMRPCIRSGVIACRRLTWFTL
jgi:hypothetical protein